jgi:hypothetical protein
MSLPRNHNHQNGHNSNNKYKEPLPIDEILFGIDRICPLELLPDAAAVSLESEDDSSYVTVPVLSVDPDDSDTAAQNLPENVSLHSTSILSIQDDLSDGRWSVAAANATASSCRAYHHVINLADLRRTASQGIQDAGSHRAVTWRVLLGYLPIQLSEWKPTLLTQRNLYRNLVRDLFVSQQNSASENAFAGNQRNNVACPLPTRSPLLQHDGNELRGYHSKKAKKRLNQQALDFDSDEHKRQEPQESTSQTPLQPVNDDKVATAAAASSTMTDASALSGDSNSSAEVPPNNNYEETNNRARNRQQNMHHRYHQIVPARIREEWKKTGRESAAIEGLSGVLHDNHSVDQPRPPHALNTLVATAHITTTPQLTEESEDRRWTEFLDSANLLDEIRKDVIRTHPDLFFFLEPEDNLGQRRYAALERILFVWATLNKGVSYHQA